MSLAQFDWPDIVIVVVLIVVALKGFIRGFIDEIGGIVAIGAAIAAGFFYNGILDGDLQQTFGLSLENAHVAGMLVGALIAYAAVVLLLWILRRFAKLPGLGTGNALGGLVVGVAKGLVFLWIVLFIALLLPLGANTRADLHRSTLVAILAQRSRGVDQFLYDQLPDAAKPFVKPLLDSQYRF
jgi:membrane protein required for colicin V production